MPERLTLRGPGVRLPGGQVIRGNADRNLGGLIPAKAGEGTEEMAREITHKLVDGRMVQVVPPTRLREILDSDGDSYDRPDAFGADDEWQVDDVPPIVVGCPTTDGWRLAQRQPDGTIIFVAIGYSEARQARERYPEYTWTERVRSVPTAMSRGRGPGFDVDLVGRRRGNAGR